MGECHLIFGPMFSSKTSELLRRLTRPIDAGLNKKVLYINHSKDCRTDVINFNNITTHNSLISKIPEAITSIKVDKLSNVDITDYEIIGIDEGHFFNDIIIVKDWVLKYNKIVHVVSLSGDFNLNNFGEVYKLIPISKVTILTAICSECLKNNIIEDAITSYKKIKDENIQIGGKDLYTPLCLKCYCKVNTL